MEPPSDSSVPYLPEFWTTTFPGAWIESRPSGSTTMRVPRGMIRVGAASSTLARLMKPTFLLSYDCRQRLVPLQLGRAPRSGKQAFFIGPAVIQDVDQRIGRYPPAILRPAPDLVMD